MGTIPLSPESSIFIHTEATAIPKQIVVHVSKPYTQLVNLPHGQSIFIIGNQVTVSHEEIEIINKIVLLKPWRAIASLPPNFFKTYEAEAIIALSSLADPSQLTQFLLKEGLNTAAERISGAYTVLNKINFANSIIADFKMQGTKLVPKNPFEKTILIPSFFEKEVTSKYKARVNLLWDKMRKDICDTKQNFSKFKDKFSQESFKRISDIYKHDAYNSLSIEGYEVSLELIQKIEKGDFDLLNGKIDKVSKETLAVKGYSGAFESVLNSLRKILEGKRWGEVVESDFREWYKELFKPSVQMGMMKAHDLAGYRSNRVFIKESMHVPPRYEAVSDLMNQFFSRLKNEEHPWVRAVLGHFIFVYIHPFMDGNGRTARFLMNAILISQGFPWTVVRVQRREEYMASLEEASCRGNIIPFSHFLLEEMKESQKYLENH